MENFKKELQIYVRDDQEFFESGMISIQEFEEKFHRLKKKGATHIRLWTPDDYSIDFNAYQVRLETDDELKDRLNKEADSTEKKELEQLAKDVKLYLELKKKFEGGNSN